MRHLSSPAPISHSIAVLVFFGDIVVLVHGKKALSDVMCTGGFYWNALVCVVCHSIHWPNKRWFCTPLMPHWPHHGPLILLRMVTRTCCCPCSRAREGGSRLHIMRMVLNARHVFVFCNRLWLGVEPGDYLSTLHPYSPFWRTRKEL